MKHGLGLNPFHGIVDCRRMWGVRIATHCVPWTDDLVSLNLISLIYIMVFDPFYT